MKVTAAFFPSSTMGWAVATPTTRTVPPVDPAASGGPPFSLLDGVSLTGSAPEPSTWAMMLLGFTGLAYAGFRNRTSVGNFGRVNTSA